MASDFRNYNFFALLSGNNHPEGFRNIILCSDVTQNNFKEKDNFFFCSYDLKNQIEELNSSGISPLQFDNFVSFRPEKKLSFNSIDEVFTKPEKSECLNIDAKTSKEDYIRNVTKLKEHIQNGDIYEIN